MSTHFGWIGTLAIVSAAAAMPARTTPRSARAPLESPCAADSSYQRLAFWIGDWEVLDSLGAHYATQRVHPAVDACALTAEWAGRVGDKGLGVSAYDGNTHEWKQMYVTNQVPGPSGVFLRKSDPSYVGPGVRFIPADTPTDGNLRRSRVTTMPMGARGAMQLFEDSRDGGKTWQVLFKAVHRPLP